MNRSLSTTFALVLLGAAGAAQAQYYGEDPYADAGYEAGYDDRYDEGYEGGYDDAYAGGYDGAYGGAYPAPRGDAYGQAGGEARDLARVLSVDPIVERGAPRMSQQCWREPAPSYTGGYPDDHYGDGRRQVRTSGNGALLGAIVGGVLGNTVGDGDGRRAATAVGAVVGGVVGNSMERDARERQAYGYRGDPRHVPMVERCRRVRTGGDDVQVVGYRVTYEYAGQVFETVTDAHPGDTIPVRVSVTPEG